MADFQVSIASAPLGAVVVPHTMIVASAVLLGVIAVALAGPVPVLLAKATWPSRAPVLALLVWQGIGLAGGLAMIAGLALAGYSLAPSGLALLPAAALAAYLLAHLATTIVQATRQRRRHLVLLDLLAAPHPTRAGTRVLDDAAPVAYCLPRGVGSVTVLSRGLLDVLDADALRAITAHERAHVEQRHDLLLLAFRAWRSALPWFPVAAHAEAEVAALVEMLADDVARRDVQDCDLARAILAVGAGRVSGAEPAEPSTRESDRFRRHAA